MHLNENQQILGHNNLKVDLRAKEVGLFASPCVRLRAAARFGMAAQHREEQHSM